MLQRAASNAYSWWWASHIRTKQSKWMEQNLQDMEEKVQYVLKLIEEDGDSFARRAEMYYKKRPELISFVEESYRAYRALAERYDHISTELQNANNTIASVFPEQVQFAMEDDDDDPGQRAPRRPLDPSKANIPKAPTKAPKEVKKAWRSANKKLQSRMSMKQPIVHPVAKSGLSPSEGLQEIDRLQRNILALQTEKEFVKSSYEGQLAKYQEIDKEIVEMQQKVCSLQDEFGAGSVIEDDEARTLMASAALKSCQDTLSQLEQKHEKSVEEAKLERSRIGEAREKLNSLKVELLDEKIDHENPTARIESVEESKNMQEPGTITQERKDMEDLRDKIREHINAASASLTVTEFAEQIDELVNKVINLEASVSLQNGLIQRMRTETDDLQTLIGILESDKAMLIQGKNEQREKLREMEEKLRGLQELDQIVEGQNKNLKIHFTEAHHNLGELSEKLHNVKPDEELEEEQNTSTGERNENPQKSELQVEIKSSDSSPKKKESESESLPKAKESETDQLQSAKQEKAELSESLEKEKERDDKIEDEPDWKHLYTEGMTEREKFLLNEYTTVLRNYKEAKKQISEASSKNEDELLDIKIQLKELKTANAKKDELIKLLRNKLGLLQAGTGDESESEKSIEVDDKLLRIEESEISQVEQKIRTGIDEVLEENLDFWLRFSSTFHQIQKFETEIKDLQSEIKKLEEKQKQEGSTDSKKQESNHDPKSALKSDAKPLYAHLREIQTELSVWLETGLQLKDEVKSRFSSLCHIQEEITAALKESAEDEDFKFTSYQAAKFQGEILNMKQENNKVSDELQAGLDHVTTLQKEIEKTLEKMDEEYKLSETKNKPDIQLEHSESRSRVPLRSFIFGIKPKKQRHSFFSVVSPLQKKYNGLKSGSGANL